MKILVTGFEPFNQSQINPSMKILGNLRTPKRTTLITEILPVEFRRSSERIRDLLQFHRPDVVISIGQAGNRPEISIERVAINIDNVRSGNGKTMLPDNAGEIRVDEPIEPLGAPAYFSTLPIWSLVNELDRKNIPATVSNSAGTYVCNHVMYTVLYEAAKRYPEMRAGFVHVPFLPEQLEGVSEIQKNLSGQNKYCMPLSDMVTGIQTILDFIGPK